MFSNFLLSTIKRSASTSVPKPSLPVFDFFAAAKPSVSYKLGHGAAGFAKNRPQLPLVSAPTRHVQVGEDAYFRRSDALGVADGVGGWVNREGANSALYSSRIMHYANLEMDRFEDTEDPCFFEYNDTNPLEILQRSYDQILQEARETNTLGSTTACIAVLRRDQLRVANIGDCGISIIRDMDYIFQSEEQQHSFNYPYQLGLSSKDQPKDAQVFTINVEKGDIIIMATDGLYDNLFDSDILNIVKKHIQVQTVPATEDKPMRVQNLQPQILADNLANEAKEVSEMGYGADTPFQHRALDEGLLLEGGKIDDISVIVAIVDDCEDSPDRRL